MASISVLSPSDSTGAELKGHLLIISAGLEFENLWVFFFLIGGKLLYNVVLVPAVQQYELALCIYVHLPSLDSQEFKPVNPKGNQH